MGFPLMMNAYVTYWVQMVAPLLLCSSIPLGIPPVQDAKLSRIAPQPCLSYVGWAGMGDPDPNSVNRAEQFLADPDIRNLRSEAARRFHLLLASSLKSQGNKYGDIPPAVLDDIPVWCDLLVTKPCALFVGPPADAKSSTLSGGFVASLGNSQATIAAKLRQYAQLARESIEESVVDAAAEFRLKDKDELRLRWTVRGNYLIVAWGGESPASIAARMDGPEPDWWTALDKDSPVVRRAVVARIDIKALIDTATKDNAESQKAAKELHLDTLQAITLVTGLDQDDFVAHLFVSIDGLTAALLGRQINRPLARRPGRRAAGCRPCDGAARRSAPAGGRIGMAR